MLGQLAKDRLTKLAVALLLTCAFGLLSGCGYATAQGRQQMAYARYVRKYSHNRVKQKTKFKKMKVPNAPESQNAAHASVSDGPQSVSSSSGSN